LLPYSDETGWFPEETPISKKRLLWKEWKESDTWKERQTHVKRENNTCGKRYQTRTKERPKKVAMEGIERIRHLEKETNTCQKKREIRTKERHTHIIREIYLYMCMCSHNVDKKRLLWKE